MLNSGRLHERLEVSVDRSLLGVGRLGDAAQKHRCSAMFWPARANYGGSFPPSMMLSRTWWARPRAPLTGLRARGVVWCTKHAGAGGG